MTIPVRLQLSRKKGFDLQAFSRATNGLEAVNVARPSKWGNPFVAHDWRASFRAVALVGRGDRAGRNGAAVKLFRLWICSRKSIVKKDKRNFWEREVMTVKAQPAPSRREIRDHLGGKNLACWCKPGGEPCHADVLLELANA